MLQSKLLPIFQRRHFGPGQEFMILSEMQCNRTKISGCPGVRVKKKHSGAWIKD